MCNTEKLREPGGEASYSKLYQTCIYYDTMRCFVGLFDHNRLQMLPRVDKKGKRVSNSSIPACIKLFLKYKVHLHMSSTTT